jgi:hypothetical protein
MSTLTLDSPAGRWVGFQVMYGIGRGLSLSIVSSLESLSLLSGSLSALPGLSIPPFRQLILAVSQQPFVAIQNTLPKQQIPAAMSLIMFLGNFSGAVAVVLCQTIFTNSLFELVPQYAPDVDPGVVIAAGSTKVRDVVAPGQIAQVLVAYAKSIDRTWYLTTAVTALAFVFAWLLGFQDIRKKPEDENSQVNNTAKSQSD